MLVLLIPTKLSPAARVLSSRQAHPSTKHNHHQYSLHTERIAARTEGVAAPNIGSILGLRLLGLPYMLVTDVSCLVIQACLLLVHVQQPGVICTYTRPCRRSLL